MLKMVLEPALIAGCAIMLSVSGVPTTEDFALCTLPSATIWGMFANETGMYRDEAATSILVSTVLSIVTLSFVIHLIDGGLGAT